jgi:hypothetical protein
MFTLQRKLETMSRNFHQISGVRPFELEQGNGLVVRCTFPAKFSVIFHPEGTAMVVKESVVSTIPDWKAAEAFLLLRLRSTCQQLESLLTPTA